MGILAEVSILGELFSLNINAVICVPFVICGFYSEGSLEFLVSLSHDLGVLLFSGAA